VGVGALALGELLCGEERAPAALRAARAARDLPAHGGRALGPRPVRQQARARALNGQPVSAELIKNERFAFIKGVPKVLGSPYRFARHGQCGHELSELLPGWRAWPTSIAIVRSMRTTQFNHAPAQVFLNTGFERAGRPSMGSWLSYGLGSENATCRLRRAALGR
jgi:hypothetical protein